MALDVGASGEQVTDGPSVSARRGTRPSSGDTGTGHVRWVLPLIVVLFAAGLRFAYLSHPERIYFDETYYAENAAQLLDYGVEAEPAVANDPSAGVEPVIVVHPPVGKWLIATGIVAFGDNSLGWRVASATAGTALVAVTYFIALRLFRRRGVAALTAFLLAIEGLALTMSRIAMLDIFLALFVAIGIWFLLIDRDRRWAALQTLGGAGPAGALRADGAGDGSGRPADGDPRADRADAEPGVGPEGADRESAGPRDLPQVSRVWRWLAGLALGLALATKWSAVLAIAAAGLFLLASELAWRRAATGRWWAHPWRLIGGGLASLILLPLVVYVASYSVWFANYEYTRPGHAACAEGPCDPGPVEIARGWLWEQVEIFRFHRDLEVTHDYRASALNWPVTRRPVVYYYESCNDDEDEPCVVAQGNVEEIIGLGNPAIWWLALPLYPLLLWAAIVRRDRVAATIAVLLLVQYLPWMVQARPLFFFYALPLVPFVVLTLGWAAGRALARPSPWWLRWTPVAGAALALAAFVYWTPIYYGYEISEATWRSRMLLDSWI